jgi:hypothetical protein
MDQRIANRIGGLAVFPDGATFDSTNPARPADVIGTLPASTGTLSPRRKRRSGSGRPVRCRRGLK